jgi:phage head maturation protease
MEQIIIKASVEAKKEGNFRVVASTGETDRMGDRINPEGWYVANYKKNPVMLWGHDSSQPPVARAEKVWVENNKLMIDGTWAPTPFAQELRVLEENGFLNTVSVGFMPLMLDEKGNIDIDKKMYRKATPEEIKSIYENDGINFEKQELLEVSWVCVPALPTALVEARKHNLELLTKSLEQVIDKEVEEKEGRVLSEKNRSLVKNCVKTMGNAIDSLKELLEATEPEKGVSPEVEEKGRQLPQQKKKSRENAELKLLRTMDKAVEILLLKQRQKDE